MRFTRVEIETSKTQKHGINKQIMDHHDTSSRLRPNN
jgi:hypothetical protein